MVINETNDSNDGSVCTHPMGVGMCAYKIRMRYKCISLPMAGRWKRIRLQRNRDLLMRDQRVDYYNNNPGFAILLDTDDTIFMVAIEEQKLHLFCQRDARK